MKTKNFTNNMSGNINNKKNEGNYKQIDLSDFDVEMYSPQFLQAKTLKKQLKTYQINLASTNSNVNNKMYNLNDNKEMKNMQLTVNFKKEDYSISKKKQQELKVIDLSQLKIKPAYSNQSNALNKVVINKEKQSQQKDSNTILAALMKKGIKPEIAAEPKIILKQVTKGPAEKKLQMLMNRKQTSKDINLKPSVTKDKRKKTQNDQIGQQIQEQFDQYGNQSFQKISGAQESAIRESIRQSIAQQSRIQESIRESIVSGSKIESIREDIKFVQSSKSLKQQIIEQIMSSHGKSKQNIEEVYEQIFEQQSLSNSFSKSQNKFKKSMNSRQIQQSLSASKSFRMKSNIAKSIKIAEQLSKNVKQNMLNDKIMNEKIGKQKQNIKQLQQNISKLINKKHQNLDKANKPSDLYLKMKIQLNKLVYSQNFESKLKKLVSFMKIQEIILPQKGYIDNLQQNILKNVMIELKNMKQNKNYINEVQKIKQQYDRKLKQQLLIQQVNLRAEMDRKIYEKDSQLKKMIAELQNKMGTRVVGSWMKPQQKMKISQKYQVESDYSIDSDNISWKADLWQLLPQYQKKKLYQKQSQKVTQFLSEMLINQLKDQSLDRSQDISFQFPQQFNISNSNSFRKKNQYQSMSNSKSKIQTQPKNKGDRHDFLSNIPKIVHKSIQNTDNFSKNQEQFRHQQTKKDQKLKVQIIKILAQYKNIYLRKKIDTIKCLIKAVSTKDPSLKANMCSSLATLTILSDKQIKKDHIIYIKAYQQQIFMNLLAIYNKHMNRRPSFIEQQMKKMFQRIIVTSQIFVAERCMQRVALDVEKDCKFNVQYLTKDAIRQMQITPCAIDILGHEQYFEYKTKRQQKQIKGLLVQQIVSILANQFAKQFPNKKK